MAEVVDLRWFSAALLELADGVREVAGAGDNPRIVEYHRGTSIGSQPDSVPWCSSFTNWCVEQAGIEGTRSAAARSWLNWGKALLEPRVGAIVILKRGSQPWQGHVGFFCGRRGDDVFVLGGNQGDRVSIAPFDAARVLGWRWPR